MVHKQPPREPHTIETIINGGPWQCPEIQLCHLKQSAHTLQISLLHNMVRTSPAVRIPWHRYHSYKYLPLLPEFIFMDFCYFSFQLL